MSDVRLWGAVLVVLGSIAGITLGGQTLLWLTAAILLVVVAVIVIMGSRPSYGTSGPLGVVLLYAGAAVCLLLPIWLTHLIKTLIE